MQALFLIGKRALLLPTIIQNNSVYADFAQFSNIMKQSTVLLSIKLRKGALRAPLQRGKKNGKFTCWSVNQSLLKLIKYDKIRVRKG